MLFRLLPQWQIVMIFISLNNEYNIYQNTKILEMSLQSHNFLDFSPLLSYHCS